MGSQHFDNLGEEDRALHDSWDHMARLVLLCAMLAALVWSLITGLRYAVHHSFEALMHFVEGDHGWLGAWVLVAVLGAVGTVRGLLIRRRGWADASGDGIDVALDNYHSTYGDREDNPQPRYDRPTFTLALKKAVATFLTLGSGGSGGLEAPAVLIGEALAAGFSRIFRIRSEHELRTYQLAGIAAAVTTLVGAPFTGALFATEIAYGDRIIYRKFAYALFAGVIAYMLNNRAHGFSPLLSAPPHAPTYTLAEYGMTALVAVAVSAPVALAFGVAMKHTRALINRMHPVLHASVTSVGVGAVALGLWAGTGLSPVHVLGMGEQTLAGVLSGDPELAVWWVLLLALLGKMLTTGLTLHGGGSAGMLIPSMYLGGVSGALTARLIILTGLAPVDLDPALFAVVGIASALVAVIGVPLAAIALVLEVFGAPYGPPAILACGVTYLMTLRISIYKTQRMSPDPRADEVGGTVRQDIWPSKQRAAVIDQRVQDEEDTDSVRAVGVRPDDPG